MLLDGKPVRTPRKAPLVLPNAALAEAIAEEWRGQGERIDPETMPLTRLANSASTAWPAREAAVIDDISTMPAPISSATAPRGRRAWSSARRRHWEPILAWAKRDLGAPMRLAEGVMHVEQPQASLDGIKKHLANSTRGASPRSMS